jgi:hypothetical protein
MFDIALTRIQGLSLCPIHLKSKHPDTRPAQSDSKG